MAANHILLFDAKCAFCRRLARDVRAVARRPVELIALSDPRAVEILSQHYPAGWPHDFYLVYGGLCRRGLRAIIGLTGLLGIVTLLRFGREYFKFRLAKAKLAGSPATAADEQAGKSGPRPAVSRRALMKAAAATPLLYGFSKLPPMPTRDESPGRLLVQVTEITETKAGFDVRTRVCHDCIRPPLVRTRRAPDPEEGVRVLDSRTLLEQDDEGLSLRVNWTRAESGGDGDAQATGIHHVLAEADRFDIGFSMGGPLANDGDNRSHRSSLAGVMKHDQALPVVDLLTYRASGSGDAGDHLAGYRAALLNLAHDYRRGSVGPDYAGLADSYEALAHSLVIVRAGLLDALATPLTPVSNQMAITPDPELFRQVDVSKAYNETPSAQSSDPCGCGLGVCCGCGVCLGCGCTLGLCFPPIPCGCGACSGCGCGSGYCCGCNVACL